MTIMRPFIRLCKAFYISTRLLNAPLIMCSWLEKVLVVFVYSTFLFGFAGLYGHFVEEGPFAITAAKKRQHGASDFIHILSVWIMQPHSINKHLWPLLDVDKLWKTSSNSLCISWKQINMKIRHDKWRRLLTWKWPSFIIGVLGEETNRRSWSFRFIQPWWIRILTA